MKGDFSRDSFDASRHVYRVLMQQGRVQLDADWNEQAAVVLHRLETIVRDAFGPCAGPDDDCGFTIYSLGDGDNDDEGEDKQNDPNKIRFGLFVGEDLLGCFRRPVRDRR